ncbi:MAG TPA: alpha/beta hydrolase [Dehalococcoidia bacterium]|nr:alpha/beta hydrolase [Dehalococcoidia bacterium]
MPRATINGVELNFEIIGEGGQPLVFVHGYTGDITDWHHQVPAFSPSFQVVAIDLRGHGASHAPTDRSHYSIDHFAEDVETLIDDLGIGRYHLLGHSMGGTIVQEIALRSQERLLSLTLHDTTDSFGAVGNNGPIAMWRDYRFKVAEEQGMAAVAAMKTPFPPPPHMPTERQASTDERLSRMSVDAFIGAWLALEAWPGTRDRITAVSVPTLVIYGDLDTGFLIEGSKRLAQNIPGAQLAVIPETGHQPQWERPELYNAALGAFLNQVTGER